MKKLIIVLSFAAFINSAYGAETIPEKVKVKTNDIRREVAEAVDRSEENVCDKTDKNCFAKKAGNRVDEAKEYVKDKASQGKNIIDNSKKD